MTNADGSGFREAVRNRRAARTGRAGAVNGTWVKVKFSEEKRMFNRPMTQVIEPIEWTDSDIERTAEYLRTGRMLIPTREVSREELEKLYPSAPAADGKSESRGTVRTAGSGTGTKRRK